MDKQDLEQIKGIVTEVVSEVFDEKFSSVMEHNIIPQFELIHSRIDTVEADLKEVKADVKELKGDVLSLKNQGATKNWVEERLDRFSIDHRLVYKPAT